MKIFPGDELEGFKEELEKNFRYVATMVPPATRTTSSERYLIARNYKGKP